MALVQKKLKKESKSEKMSQQPQPLIFKEKKMNQEAKADKGKLRISLVPTQIIKDISQVRMYGNEKYGDSDNWRTVEVNRYIDALLRHTLEFIRDKKSKDEESGIEHYKHMACNMAFICEMMEDRKNEELESSATERS